jgi:hypothetical protein
VSIQDRPVCWGCDELIEHSAVFAAPCDHPEHSSAVWHGLCLMEWRENREKRQQAMQRFFSTHRAYMVIEPIEDDS